MRNKYRIIVFNIMNLNIPTFNSTDLDRNLCLNF